MTSRARRFALSTAALLATTAAATAADFAAVTSGNWSSPNTWTGTAVPGAGDTAYIGSTYPTGGAPTATVSLTQNTTAYGLYLGYGGGLSGTLNLGNSTFTANFIVIGNSGTGTITRGTGHFEVSSLYVQNGNALTLGAGDVTSYLEVSGGSAVTTAAAGNLTQTAYVYGGSTLTLGANLSVTGNVDVYGNNSTLNAAGHAITAGQLYVGWNGGSNVQLLNRGTLTVGSLYVANQPFNLTSADQVANFALSNGSTTLGAGTVVQNLGLSSGSTAATTETGNVTQNIAVYTGSTLTLGAPLSVAGYVDLSGDNSTLNAAGHAITAGQLYVGWNGGSNVQLLNRGTLTVGSLYVANQPFNLTSADQVANFSLSSGATVLGAGTVVQNLGLSNAATATTTETGNVTDNIAVYTGSTLTLGAPLSVAGTVDLSGDNSTLNAQGHAVTANQVLVGWNGGSNVQLLNRGTITANYLFVANQPFNLTSADQVANFYLSNGSTAFGAGTAVQNLALSSGSTATTTETGNITQNVSVASGSTLTLGAPLTVAGAVDLQGDSSTLNAQGHAVTASQVFVGWYGGANVQLLNRGPITADYLYVANQPFGVTVADQVANLYLSNATTTLGAGTAVQNLTLYSAATATTTETGNVTQYVTVTSGSTLTLGAPLTVSGYVDIYGDDSTLNAQGHAITAAQVNVGWNGGANVQLLNRGTITANYLYVANQAQPFNLTAADQVGSFYLSNGSTAFGAGTAVQNLTLYNAATATTTETGNITQNVAVTSGSTLTLGAPLTVSGSVDLQGDNSAINAQGQAVTASQVLVGWNGGTNVQFLNRGPITADYLYVANQPFGVTVADQVANLYLSNATTTLGAGTAVQNLTLYNAAAATTTETANVTQNVEVQSGSTLTLGAPLAVAGSVNLYGDDSTLNAQGHAITASQVLVGWYGGNNVQLANRGTLTVANLYVANQAQPFNLTSADQVASFNLSNAASTLGAGTAVQNLTLYNAAAVTTTGSENLAQNVTLYSGSTLTLGANLGVTGTVYLQDAGSAINAQNRYLDAVALYAYSTGPGSAVTNDAAVAVGYLQLMNAARVDLHGGNDSAATIYLGGDSRLNLKTVPGQSTGFALTGEHASNLGIADTSKLTIDLNGSWQGWVFRWTNPTGGGDHIADLQDLINQGRIEFVVSNGGEYQLLSPGDGFTYIMQPVPEPAAVLGLAALAAGAFRLTRRRFGV